MINRALPSSRGKHHAGFTLIELMVVVAIAGTVGSTLAMFFLHHRALTRSVSVDEALTQEAKLLVDHLRRDARASARAVSDRRGDALLLQGARRVRYRVQREGGMARVAGPMGTEHAKGGETVTTTFPRVVRLSARQDGSHRALRVEIALEARLDPVRRRQRVVATVLLGGAP